MSQPASVERRRRAEDKEDEIPKDWCDATFSTDKRDPRRLQLPPQKYREWYVSKSTRREALERMPLYRLPQLAYLMHKYREDPSQWSSDASGRLFCTVPREDEASVVLQSDVRPGEWLMYVVLPNPQLDFPDHKIFLRKPAASVLDIDFSNYQKGRAVGLIKARPLKPFRPLVVQRPAPSSLPAPGATQSSRSQAVAGAAAASDPRRSPLE